MIIEVPEDSDGLQDEVQRDEREEVERGSRRGPDNGAKRGIEPSRRNQDVRDAAPCIFRVCYETVAADPQPGQRLDERYGG